MSFLYVKAYYGPCTTFNRCVHRPQLLTGLRDRLQKLGFRIDLIPVDGVNYCMLEMCGHEVFRCKLGNFKFNTAWNRDPVCAKAVEAVMGAAVKFRRARAILWFWSLLDHQMFRRGEYCPKDYFANKVLKKYESGAPHPTHTCENCNDFFKFSNEQDYGEKQMATWMQNQVVKSIRAQRRLKIEENYSDDALFIL